MSRAPVPRLHVVTDDAVLASEDFVARARRVLEVAGRRSALHVRGPRSTGRVLFDLVTALRPAARASGATLLVNDRVDVVLAADADGVHLGERSLPVAEARALLGPSRVVGASVHGEDALRRAASDGANHALVGTVYPTASHPGRPGIGTDRLAGILGAASGIPVIGIGGIEPGRVGDVLRAGAHGVGVLSGVWARPDPEGAVLEYLASLEGAYEEKR